LIENTLPGIFVKIHAAVRKAARQCRGRRFRGSSALRQVSGQATADVANWPHLTVYGRESAASDVYNRAMRIGKRVALWAAIIGLMVVLGVTAAATFYRNSVGGTGSQQGGNVLQSVSWRVQIYARKAEGGIRDLSWAELWQMTRAQGGFGLDGVVNAARSLDGSVTNRYVTDADHQSGARLFREHCAVCHGGGGTGGHGPSLTRSGFKHGESDLAIYKILRDGIPDTAMPAATLSLSERWQVVGYVRTLQLHARAAIEASPLHIKVSSEQIRAAGTAGSRSDEWLTYSGSLDGHRYTPLTEITPANVSQLRVRWIQQFDSNGPIEATPLVVDGVMFTTLPPSDVIALDVKTGRGIWKYSRNVPADVPVCCGRVNRGVAILGSVLFLEALDGYLVAINANTGEVLWQIRVVDPANGYAMTGAPLIVNRSVIVGIAGGEFGTRGFLVSYDAATGQEQWKFSTIPGPGDPGHETWENDAWRTGGAPTWTTGSYDPSLDLIYWGVGNPGPDFTGSVRPGDNLYANSVIALHASSGKLAWHFQFTPHDEHDWDSAQTPILADVVFDGKPRQVICWANRNGFYYVLDRASGEFLQGVPFVELNWAKGLDSKGRPILSEAGVVSGAGQLIKPGVGGATNWQNPAIDQARGLIFVHATEGSSVFTNSPQPSRGDQGIYVASAGSITEPMRPVVRALDVTTGARRWENFSPPIKEGTFAFSGLLATGTGLVFGASGGSAFALDSETGHELWRVLLGGDSRAAPISFTVDGRQVIALSAGRSLFVFGL
jgi:alcohol dehydrogenase (cytochrome c)